MKIDKRIRSLIKKSSNVFVMGHKHLDLDAIGGCVGIKAISNFFKKECYVIIDDKEHELSVNKVLDEIKNSTKIINSEEVADLCKKNSILIIVDTNKTNLLQNDKILHNFNDIIVIDHHEETDQALNCIDKIDLKASSACEMVSNLIRDYGVTLTKEEATIVLSGIVLDTHNFTKKVTPNTYYESYFLTEYGADVKKIQYYLKEDLKNYIIRDKVVMNTEIINDKYAIAKANDKQKYKREELAKIADTLLGFDKVEASFVLGNRVDGGVGISARSIGNVDVAIITEELGGGGDKYHAACQINDMTLKEVNEELRKILSKGE